MIEQPQKSKHRITATPRTYYERMLVETAMEAVESIAEEIERNHIAGFTEMGPQKRIDAFLGMLDKAPKVGSTICFELESRRPIAAYAGVDTGILGDDPDLAVLALSDMPGYEMTPEGPEPTDVPDYDHTLARADVHPTYKAALVARGLCNQLPTLTLPQACRFAVTGQLPDVPAMTLQALSSRTEVYGFVLRSMTMNPSNETMKNVGTAVRNDWLEVEGLYDVANLNGTEDGKRSTSEFFDRLLKEIDAVLEEHGKSNCGRGGMPWREMYEILEEEGVINSDPSNGFNSADDFRIRVWAAMKRRKEGPAAKAKKKEKKSKRVDDAAMVEAMTRFAAQFPREDE